MYISQETNDSIETGTLSELEQMIYDIRDAVNTRDDVQDVIDMLASNGVTLSSGFCKRKRPTS